MGLPKQEYWRGCPPPGDLPTQELNTLQVNSLPPNHLGSLSFKVAMALMIFEILQPLSWTGK